MPSTTSLKVKGKQAKKHKLGKSFRDSWVREETWQIGKIFRVNLIKEKADWTCESGIEKGGEMVGKCDVWRKTERTVYEEDLDCSVRQE